MELKATIGFVHPSRYDTDNILTCNMTQIVGGPFDNQDIQKQAYAIMVMVTELTAAVQRVNDRLKSEGLTKENFIYCKPKQAPRYDENGNLITSI